MPRNHLVHALNELYRTLQDCRKLAADAYRWSLPGSHPHISRARAESINELAFLRACIAWEAFLEESFILYVMGKRSPKGRAPTRYTIPTQRNLVEQLIIPEKHKYAGWSEGDVNRRSVRFFRNGYPFAPALRARQVAFEEMRTIRNATAHGSNDCWEKFKTVVRNKLTIVPYRLTIGGFLSTTLIGSVPPKSILDTYLDVIESTAQIIVRV